MQNHWLRRYELSLIGSPSPQETKWTKVMNLELGMVLHTCNPSTEKVEAGGWQVWGQPWLHGKPLSQKPRTKSYEPTWGCGYLDKWTVSTPPSLAREDPLAFCSHPHEMCSFAWSLHELTLSRRPSKTLWVKGCWSWHLGEVRFHSVQKVDKGTAA
jgi:hypothetical protein